jgi:hypothetical protein
MYFLPLFRNSYLNGTSLIILYLFRFVNTFFYFFLLFLLSSFLSLFCPLKCLPFLCINLSLGQQKNSNCCLFFWFPLLLSYFILLLFFTLFAWYFFILPRFIYKVNIFYLLFCWKFLYNFCFLVKNTMDSLYLFD